MDKEIISEVTINSKNELFLKIRGEGKPMYQYIYREAAGVGWDQKNKGFTSSTLRDWTVSQWYFHILSIVKSGLELTLELDKNITWGDIPELEKEKILNGQGYF